MGVNRGKSSFFGLRNWKNGDDINEILQSGNKISHILCYRKDVWEAEAEGEGVAYEEKETAGGKARCMRKWC